MPLRFPFLAISLFLFLIMGWRTANASAATCTVGSTHLTLQTAINDTTCIEIDVPSGTFGSIEIGANRVVTINGESGTVLDGNGTWRVITIFRDATVTLNNLSIVNADFQGFGGGIYTWPGVTLTLNDISLSNNRAEFAPGGALFVDTGASATIRSSIFYSNTAGSGGAIENRGTLMIHDSIFDNNTSDGYGGAIV